MIKDDFLLSLLRVPGVYVPAGVGVGPGGTGPGAGFFPGNNDCLDSLNKHNPEPSHNKQSVCLKQPYNT